MSRSISSMQFFVLFFIFLFGFCSLATRYLFFLNPKVLETEDSRNTHFKTNFSHLDLDQKCLLTQDGVDGFGHQFEGKLSCMLMASFLPKLKYFHTPIYAMEHSVDYSEAEEFSGMGKIIPHTDLIYPYLRGRSGTSNTYVRWRMIDYPTHMIDYLLPTQVRKIDRRNLKEWINRIGFQNGTCDPFVLYKVDNCWDFIYQDPYNQWINDKNVIRDMRKIYLSSNKPETGFDGKKLNIVIHIRKGDATTRYLDSSYYQDAMAFYVQYFKTLPATSRRSTGSNPLSILFWLETDAPSEILQDSSFNTTAAALNDADIKVAVAYPDANGSIFLAFHRMVQADGIVMSYSAFSAAAALLNSRCPKLVTSSKPDPLRQLWYETDRFHIVPERTVGSADVTAS